jgi:DNA-directed RNA polymerase subunit beta'
MFVNDPKEFEFLEIFLASPDRIRFWSYGEIEKPETINYRTFKPERKGLFCEKIFGPVKDWECSCGKYRRIRYRGIVCERCGVEVTHSKVRRERMGHIELAAPVTHIWFLKGIPSYMGILLNMSSRQLEEVIYYDSYIIIAVDETIPDVKINQIVSTVEFLNIKEKYGDKVTADIGAAAIRTLLRQLNLEKLSIELRNQLEEAKGQNKQKLIKRLRVIESVSNSGNKPEWLVLDAIPVMPPDLRPMVQLEGGRFATSDLNDLYRRVVNRNNRLKRLKDIGAPDMIIRNEKRMLQESVDVLIANGKRGRAVTGSNNRPLKSLGNIIEGKQGRFRQNLLGKRVDYSARSVIVVGPHLKFNQCGLPKEMALELFKPFVLRKLVEEGFSSNVKNAKRKIEERDVVIWSIVEKVIKGRSVLLNRAPTLHRLGIQAFQPILVEGSAIQVHPLVCTAFNADFDGDQMAVHLPLGIEAQAECKFLIESTNNILSPSSGKAIVTPTQDMILGCYYLTVDNKNEKLHASVYGNVDEILRAHSAGVLNYQSKIRARLDGQIIETTLGRVIFNEAIRDILRESNLDLYEFINVKIGKSELSDLIYNFYIQYGNEITGEIANALKNIGFRYSTLSGISISIDDLTIPDSKPELINEAVVSIEQLNVMETKGLITNSDKKYRTSEIWRTTSQKVSDALSKTMGELNNVYIMANSGARGNMDQVRQLAGMRGLMSDSRGRTIEIPIRSNFKEGLTLTEYFISAYGARKGLVDTALRTADSGYLTRRLVDVAQDIMVTEEDCGATEGIDYTALKSGFTNMVSLADIIEGRSSLETIKNASNKIIVKKGDIISKKGAIEIEASGVKSVKTRSIFTCISERGACQKCYGIDLSTTREVNIGEAIGIIAAQSIGEPGTQLTMRTFHTGGVDLRRASLVSITANADGKVKFSDNFKLSKLNEGKASKWIINDHSIITIEGKKNSVLEIPKYSKILVKDEAFVKKGDVIAEYDPYDLYVISTNNGIAYYDESLVVELDQADGSKVLNTKSHGEVFVYTSENVEVHYFSKTNAEKLEVNSKILPELIKGCEHKTSGLVLSVTENKESTKKSSDYKVEIAFGLSYAFSRGSMLYVKNKAKVAIGDCLVAQRVVTDVSKTEDIVQGLPKVEELFEARKPKDSATVSEIDGVVDIEQNNFCWNVIVSNSEGDKKEYKIAFDSILLASTGQEVKKGDKLNEGAFNPHDIAKTKNIEETRRYLADEVQRVYASQGVQINKKHIEVIIKQMTKKVVLTDMGDSTLLLNEIMDRKVFNEINEKLIADGKKPCESMPLLLGITRASLSTDSFISASSFQQTSGVLTKAALEGQRDNMFGLKENVIIGKLIPAGTGIFDHEHIVLKFGNNQEINEDFEASQNDKENVDSIKLKEKKEIDIKGKVV